MSSFDSAREQWELYHMNEIKKAKEAAENGDPEAMETMAYHIAKVGYPGPGDREKVISLLTSASDAGRRTASWKLADFYAHMDGFNGNEHHEKIEYYCRLAFSGGNIFSHKEPDAIWGTIQYWIEKHHPEWCEKEEEIRSDGKYYIWPTYRYGMNVFRGMGEEAARQKLSDGKDTE